MSGTIVHHACETVNTSFCPGEGGRGTGGSGGTDLLCRDLQAGYDGVFMPGALDRKWKSAAKEHIWQWFFPAKTLTLVPQENERRRYHMHETELQKALRHAVRMAQIPKRVTCHTLRHSFASHLLRANYDIRTIQQLLGHSDIRTTMIYTHTVQSRTLKEMASPLDFSPEQVGFTEETSSIPQPAPGA